MNAKPIPSTMIADSKFDIGWIYKDTKCWVYFPNQEEGDIYLRGIVQKITPLNFNKGNSNVRGILENGIEFETKAHLLEKSRESHSIERDLIEMDIINGAEVLNQLKMRFQERRIHTYLWNSLIIVNPFERIPNNYGQKALNYFYESVFLKEEFSLPTIEPHIYAFILNILREVHSLQNDLIQVLSISGESGSGKTETNKQCLKAISFCCEREKLKSSESIEDDGNMEEKILQCDSVLQVFGNAKTVKNDNSSRFGKLISIKIEPQFMVIKQSSIRNYFLEKSRIISQAAGERNFHVFYLFLKFMPENERVGTYRLKSGSGAALRFEDFSYLSQKHSYSNNDLLISEKDMWAELLKSFDVLGFEKQQVSEIWSIVAAILLLGNVTFDGSLQNDNDPCEIENVELVGNIAQLLKIPAKELEVGLIFNKKIIADELMYLPLTEKQCAEGRDSISKAIYEGLFKWIVGQLNIKVNGEASIGSEHSQGSRTKQIKLLDIYGFEVFEKNSFEQLCVNYTNEKIHQIYLEQVFIHEKKVLKEQHLESAISGLNFTDNYRIIELIESSPKSIYNLLDESCTLEVKDTDFLASVRKTHENHEHFPPSNSNNIRNSFIIKHTPGDIEYMVSGFRDKNKDLLREGIVHQLAKSQSKILQNIFEEKNDKMSVVGKSDPKKKYLGMKIRREVKELIHEMSTQSNLHFVRCIKPNEEKKPFTFIDRVSYNQIRYLGILDTIQMRKESYHVRIPYRKFYQKFGILEDRVGLDRLIAIQNKIYNSSDCKQISMSLMTNQFTNHKLEYLFGKERIFMKMSTKNFLDVMLRNKTQKIEHACTLIKANFRVYSKKRQSAQYLPSALKLQRAVRNYLHICRISRKKRAVITIQNAWIKNCLQFFMRKRRDHVMTLQKYIKRTVENLQYKKHLTATLYAKQFLQSALKTHKHSEYIRKFEEVQSVIRELICEKAWQRLKDHNKQKIENYLKTFVLRKLNKQKLFKGEQVAMYRQNMRYLKTVETYLRGHLNYQATDRTISSVTKIQKYLRMRPYGEMYTSLKKNTIKIQKSWRLYFEAKQLNIFQTKQYFEAMMAEEKRFIQDCLFRPIPNPKNLNSFTGDHFIEQVLQRQEKVKQPQPKISLFYYLLDFEMLSDVSYIYPGKSWVMNYCELFKDSFEKSNPIQTLDISDTHTVCTTINKVYQWGEICVGEQQNKFAANTTFKGDFSDSEFADSGKKPPNQELRAGSGYHYEQHSRYFPIPLQVNSHLLKVRACDNFTLIETEDPQELLVMGDQKSYEQSTVKEWTMLNGSYVLLNGVVLALEGCSLKRIPISEKVVSLSCGMSHVITKTSLRRVYTWGEGKMGQLGLGNFARSRDPASVEFFHKNKIVPNQIGASAYGSVVLDMNCKVWWFGSNGTISNEPYPIEALLSLKSQVIDNSKKYSVVRILPKWSKSLSIIGVTVANYDGAFKPTQTTLRKKSLEHLMGKWCENETVNPPHIGPISGNFSEKHMYIRKNEGRKEEGLSYRQIKNKLMNEMLMIEHAEKQLLKTLHKRND